MPRIRAIPNWPSSTRLLWVALAPMLLSTLGIIGRDWVTYFYDTDSGPIKCNLVGMGAVLVVLCGLAVLSWTEQRLHRTLLEALIAATGWLIPILIDNVRHAVPTWLLVFTFLVGLLLFAVVRLISLAFVRIFLRKLVLSAAPLCQQCGCDLTGNVSGTCPECGTACLDTGTAPETAGATEDAELRGQYHRPGVLLAAVCVLGLLMAWMAFDDFRSGYDLRRIGRDLILTAILAGLLATIYVRQRKA